MAPYQMTSLLNSRPEGWPTWLNNTDHIGSHYPYYTLPSPNQVSLEISDIIEDIPPSERQLDLTGVVEILFGRRLLGNRTLVKGVRRTPWMASCFENGFRYHDIPTHHSHRRPVGNVVSELENALYEEVCEYIHDGDAVAILLSGGLDSRILAGILRQVQLDGGIESVTAFTWGIDECRDVVYARRVADRYDWPFEQLQLSADLLWENIVRTGEIGAEFAPYHLHALPVLRERDDIDAVLAGSYGNSVGRGEYAGDHVAELNRIVPRRLNKFGVLPNEIVSRHRETVHGDAYGYRDRVDRNETYQYREIEQQLHYMRRGLQSCMTHVAERIPLYQLFTAPAVVELMWELDPNTRGLDHYRELLERLPGDLEAIPDAKLGSLDQDLIDDDDLAVRAHKYGTWLRDDLRADIIECIQSGPLAGQLCNERTLNQLFRIWPYASTTTMNRVDDVISWLASLSIFVETYDITVPEIDTSAVDLINTIVGPLHAGTYQTARGFVRK